jgi:hypothetical protein
MPFTGSWDWTIEDEQCQSFGDRYTAVKLKFLLFSEWSSFVYADPASNIVKAES